MKKGPDQRIVVYGSGNGVVYDTAYTEEQVSEAMNRCIRLHGYRAQVHCIPDYKRPIEEI